MIGYNISRRCVIGYNRSSRGFVITMAAASLATSVPDPTAMPMSAALRAGASLTPGCVNEGGLERVRGWVSGVKRVS